MADSTNGGFETGDFTGWTVSGPGNAFVDGEVGGVSPPSGNFQAGVQGGILGGNSITQNVATTIGASYVVSFWVAAIVLGPIPAGQAFLSVSFGGSSIFSHLFTASSDYTEYTSTVTASSATTALVFGAGADGFNDLILFDDVSVNPVGVPDAGSTLPLLSFALLGVAVLRRKLGC
jgi:VPDSG-CTERM motif